MSFAKIFSRSVFFFLVFIHSLFLTKAYHSGHLEAFIMERLRKNYLLLHDGGPYHIETSPLIDCFYMIGNEKVNGLNVTVLTT